MGTLSFFLLLITVDFLLLITGEPEPGVFGSLEPELEPDPLEKNKSRSRLEKKSEYGAFKKLACWKMKSIRKLYFFYSSLGKNSKFLWLKKQLFYLFYIFCSFTLLPLRGEE